MQYIFHVEIEVKSEKKKKKKKRDSEGEAAENSIVEETPGEWKRFHLRGLAHTGRVATAQGKQGNWFLLFPDRENTGNFVLTQGKYLDCDY